MTDITRCDKCNKELTYLEKYISHTFFITASYDLCNDCYSKFKKWLKEK